MPIPGDFLSTLPSLPFFTAKLFVGLGGYGDDPLSDHEDTSSRIPPNPPPTSVPIATKFDVDVRAFIASSPPALFPSLLYMPSFLARAFS